jgi:hypothetical protein
LRSQTAYKRRQQPTFPDAQRAHGNNLCICQLTRIYFVFGFNAGQWLSLADSHERRQACLNFSILEHVVGQTTQVWVRITEGEDIF